MLSLKSFARRLLLVRDIPCFIFSSTNEISVDPECDIAVATMAQLLLQQGKVTEALKYFERAAELSRTEGEIVNALSYAEATRTQLEVQEKWPQLADRLKGMSGNNGLGAGPR